MEVVIFEIFSENYCPFLCILCEMGDLFLMHEAHASCIFEDNLLLEVVFLMVVGQFLSPIHPGGSIFEPRMLNFMIIYALWA